jgi:hypothetical protein
LSSSFAKQKCVFSLQIHLELLQGPVLGEKPSSYKINKYGTILVKSASNVLITHKQTAMHFERCGLLAAPPKIFSRGGLSHHLLKDIVLVASPLQHGACGVRQRIEN